MIIRTALIIVAVLIFVLIGFDAITDHVFRWQQVGFAAGFASMIPWPR